MVSRRDFLAGGAAAGLSAIAFGEALAQGALPPKSPMGIGSASLGNYGDVVKGADAIRTIEYVRSLGAGGIQFSPSGDLTAVRRKLEELGMFVEGNARLPARLSEDTAAFEKSLADAKAVGATIVRSVSRPPQGTSGRRYESFKSYEEFKAWETEANAIVLKCLPIAERLGMKLALENHKDRVVDDHAEFLRKTSSEYLGALVDPGNNVSLLETPEETVRKLAPFALACSLKDMGVAPYEDGFLLSEVVFGDGFTDQAALFKILKAANPRINPVEELITRDPLKVPVNTPGYWVSFPPERKARLQPIMQLVRTRQTKLPYVAQLTPQQRMQAEADNHRKTLTWARTNLA
jgi:sugar phosphate isomerase/epimerase